MGSLVVLLLFSALPPVGAEGVATGGIRIEVHGDRDLTPANGVVGGAGTADDPFVIGGWALEGPGATVSLDGTRAFVVLRDLTVTVVGGGSGISIVSSVHVTLENVTVNLDPESAWRAAEVQVSSDITVRGSVFHGGDVLFDRVSGLRLEATHVDGGIFDFNARANWDPPADMVVADDNTVDGGPFVVARDSVGVSVVDRPVGQLLAFNCSDVVLRNLTGADALPTLILWGVENASVTDVHARGVWAVGSNMAMGGLRLESPGDFLLGGLQLEGDHVSVRDTEVRGGAPLVVMGGDDIDLDGLHVEGGSWAAATVYGSSNVTITNATVNASSLYGVYLADVENLTFESNVVAGSMAYGLVLYYAQGASILNSTVEGGVSGIDIERTQEGEVRLHGNTIGGEPMLGLVAGDAGRLNMTDNRLGARGMVLTGTYADAFVGNSIDETNVLDSGPVRYFANCDGLVLDGVQAGQVILANCTGARVANLRMEGAAEPLQASFVLDLDIENVTLAGNSTGAWLYAMEGVNVTDSRLSGKDTCLSVSTAALVRVAGGNFSGCDRGVRLETVWASSVVGVTVDTDLAGVELVASEHVRVARNTMHGGGISLLGHFRDSYSTIDVAPDNTVDGAPIEFHRNETGGVVRDRTVGQFIAVNCARLALENITTTGGSPGGLFAYDDGLTVSNSSFSHSRSDGVWLTTSDNVVLRHVNASQNGVETTAPSASRGGVYINQGTTTVLDSTFDGNGYWGIRFDEPTDLKVAGGSASGNAFGGIAGQVTTRAVSIRDMLVSGNEVGGQVTLGEHGSVDLSNVSVVGNAQDGFYAHGPGKVTASGSVFSHNGGAGLNASGVSLTVGESAFEGNAIGLIVYGQGRAVDSVIWYNTISDNGVGLQISSTRRLTVIYNQFLGNGVQAMDDGTTDAWDAGFPNGGNLWSDYNGTDRCTSKTQDICPIPDGLGDTPYEIQRSSGSPGDPILDHYPLMEPKAPPTALGGPPPADPAEPTPDVLVFLTTLPGALLLLMAVPAAAAAFVWGRSRRRPPPGGDGGN